MDLVELVALISVVLAIGSVLFAKVHLFLKHLRDYLADGRLTEDEVIAIIKELNALRLFFFRIRL